MFYTVEKIGPTRDWTPEGYLVCRDVPIARTGSMYYAPGEVPVPPDSDGVIVVERTADDLFRPETIASFEGKPLTNNHPTTAEGVTPATWKMFAVGAMHNVRRDGDLLVSDLMINDPHVIDAVMSGKRQFSCGYDAEYEVVRDGFARQHGIVGNHGAIVAEGRCGPRCSIGDSADMATKRTVWDRLKGTFLTGDQKAFDEALEEAKEDAGEGDKPVEVHVHNYPSGKPEVETSDEEGEPEEKATDPLAALTERMDGFETSLKTLAEAVQRLASAEAQEVEQEATETTEDEDPEDDGDLADNTMARDSASLMAEWRQTMAAAEVLSPGIALPTRDAKASVKVTNDALCTLRRRALAAAFKRQDGKQAIIAVSPSFTPAGLKGMTCDAVSAAFNASAALLKANLKASAIFTPANASGENPIAKMNERARAVWADISARQ